MEHLGLVELGCLSAESWRASVLVCYIRNVSRVTGNMNSLCGSLGPDRPGIPVNTRLALRLAV